MNNVNNSHIVILRSYGDILNLATYNCQEIGLAKALIKKGFRVTYMMPDKYDGESTLETSHGKISISHISIAWKLHARYCWFSKLETRLEELRPDILQVHDMDLLMTWRAVKWAKKTKTHCVLIQGPYDKWKTFGFRQFNEIYNRLIGHYIIKNVSSIGVKTLRASDYLNKYCKCETNQVIIGLDVDSFSDKCYKDWRKELGIEEKKVLLYVGNLQKRRNPLFLLDVLRLLPDSYVLLIVGVGDLNDEVAQYIKTNELNKRCYLLGKMCQKELPAVYSSADCFLLASDYEILGMVIMEAMYWGLPVVSSDTTGSRFIMKDGVTGFIMSDLNADTWKDKIEDMFRSPETMSEMGRVGRNVILENFVWDKTVDGFVNLYFGK